jgi:predicted DNA-binding transcriptional regulator AlpA
MLYPAIMGLQGLPPTDMIEGNMDTEKRLSTAETAEYLRLSAATLRWYRHAGIGPRSYRLGRRVFYDAADVRAWEEAQKAATWVGGCRG